MGMITSIELTKSRATIYVDGVVFMRMKRAFFDEMPLREGDELDEEAYTDKLCARQLKPAYEAALDILADRDLTAAGLKTALTRKGYLAPVAEVVCERLADRHLIDDSRYAHRYVELRQEGNLGRYALKRKLRAKGVDEDTANEALEQIDDETQLAAAVELARKLKHRYAGEDPDKARAKLSQALARRGFSWEAISAALEQCDIGAEDD